MEVSRRSGRSSGLASRNKMGPDIGQLIVWRILSGLGGSVRRVLAVLLMLGKNVVTLVEELQRWILASLGWLSAPPTSKMLRHLGTSFLHTRRWQFGAGKLYSPVLWFSYLSYYDCVIFLEGHLIQVSSVLILSRFECFKICGLLHVEVPFSSWWHLSWCEKYCQSSRCEEH